VPFYVLQMLISEFDYELPPELIAQQPLDDRSASRLLVVDREAGRFVDCRFTDFAGLLREGDVLVLNNTKVFPARLLGRTETGAAVEIFLVTERHGLWEALARPAKRLHAGKRVIFDEDLSAEIVNKRTDGKVILDFSTSGDLNTALERIGRTPLPPYIKRDTAAIDTDRERYQTVFAKNRGAIAAPTAGLHFTPEILQAIKKIGVTLVEITLHVGYGTFEPVRVEDLSEHNVSPETYEIDEAAATILNEAKAASRRIVAVGTTTTRALEHNSAMSGQFGPGQRTADLTITPGYTFRAAGALLTNFHLPRSSLLVLVSTFAGHELIMKAYEHAVDERYSFYSYGDCMLIV
jgi:S-adenosylmethionine:tRNA ribosyltransferase-isomerase